MSGVCAAPASGLLVEPHDLKLQGVPTTQREFAGRLSPSANIQLRTDEMAATAANFLKVSEGFAEGMRTSEPPQTAISGLRSPSVSFRPNPHVLGSHGNHRVFSGI